MVKVTTISGDDYSIRLYSNNEFVGSRKVYFYRGNYYVKYKGYFREILDFNLNGVFLASVDVNELYLHRK